MKKNLIKQNVCLYTVCLTILVKVCVGYKNLQNHNNWIDLVQDLDILILSLHFQNQQKSGK